MEIPQRINSITGKHREEEKMKTKFKFPKGEY